MIKRYCDICKREIDQYVDKVRPYYRTRAFELDMCLDCKDRWDMFKEKTLKKYERLYEELYSSEQKEICAFLGVTEDEFHKDHREEELL